jgi:hypothetical protein
MGLSMGIFQNRIGRFPAGVWVAVLALLCLCLAWVMQAYSLVDWNSAVELGLQNERFDGDPVEQAWALESWGVVMADMLWALPLTILGLAGIFWSRLYGFVSSMMAFAIGAYFPLVFAFQRWGTYRGTAIIALCLWTLPCLLGTAGLWVNRQMFKD